MDRREGNNLTGVWSIGVLFGSDCKISVWEAACTGAAEAFRKRKNNYAGDYAERRHGSELTVREK